MRAPLSLIFLAAIALLGIGAGIGLVIVSSRSPHALVRADYYRDGLKLDDYRAREAAFDSLGVELSLRADRGALLLEATGSSLGDSRVRDRLTGLEVMLQLRRPDDPTADRDVLLTLASDQPPLWVADVEALRRGRWNARAVFSDAAGNPVMERGFVHDATHENGRPSP